jgi:molecular chaperone DnaK
MILIIAGVIVIAIIAVAAVVMGVREDKKRKEVVEAKNQADALIHQTEKTLAESGEAVSADEKAKIEAAIKELKDVVAKDGVGKDEIEVATRNLASASHKLAEAMYKKEGGEAGAPHGAQGGQAKKDDDVIDAEVE